jgi:hypothetical protein
MMSVFVYEDKITKKGSAKETKPILFLAFAITARLAPHVPTRHALAEKREPGMNGTLHSFLPRLNTEWPAAMPAPV